MQKILIVEDEPILQKTLNVALQQEGYEIKNALDGEEGIRMAREFSPNLILLDLVLPKIDGFEALEELKKEEKTKAIPVIVLINAENETDIEKAKNLGAVSYLVKANYDLKDAIKKVQETIK